MKIGKRYAEFTDSYGPNCAAYLYERKINGVRYLFTLVRWTDASKSSLTVFREDPDGMCRRVHAFGAC